MRRTTEVGDRYQVRELPREFSHLKWAFSHADWPDSHIASLPVFPGKPATGQTYSCMVQILYMLFTFLSGLGF